MSNTSFFQSVEKNFEKAAQHHGDERDQSWDRHEQGKASLRLLRQRALQLLDRLQDPKVERLERRSQRGRSFARCKCWSMGVAGDVLGHRVLEGQRMGPCDPWRSCGDPSQLRRHSLLRSPEADLQMRRRLLCGRELLVDKGRNSRNDPDGCGVQATFRRNRGGRCFALQ